MKNKFLILFLTTFSLCLGACNNHQHSFSHEWKSDETYHWHEAICGHDVVSEKGEHVFGKWIIDLQPTETEYGKKHKECSICKYRVEEQIEKYIGPDVDPIIEKVTITFDSNGGSGTMAPVEIDRGSEYTLPICSFVSPENKEFDKWLIGEIEYSIGSKIVVNQDIVIKAIYRDIQEEVEPVPAYITITNPTKLDYVTGDELDLTGLTVTLYYDNGDYEDVALKDVSITGYDKTKVGKQTITITYLELSETFDINVKKKYDEAEDSTEGVDTSDLSALYSAFATPINNYSSTSESFFNEVGLYDYFRHYQKNYIQEKVNLYTQSIQFSYPKSSDYLNFLNTGYLNLNNNLYSYSLKGDDIASRLNSSLTNDDLHLEKENATYQDDLFTLGDINQTYLENSEFTRVSENKYQCTKGKDVYDDFIDICAPQLINEGYYMTFSKVTVELNPLAGVALRIRLYASSTQSGKLKNINKDKENKPNWYMLFSEALIYDINQTTFHPSEGLA